MDDLRAKIRAAIEANIHTDYQVAVDGEEYPVESTDFVGATDDVMAVLADVLPKWIPVSERLPKGEVPCLVCTVGLADTAPVRTLDWWSNVDGRWSHNPVGTGRDVTHWMPLPALPTQESR